jgi:hypothetical protein
MLPPLGIIFGLFVAFTAAQVWSDIDRANAAVSREASSLRAAVILSSTFPGQPEARLRGLIRQYVQEAVDQEWPMMASQTADLRMTARALAEALRFTLALAPTNHGQQTAQRELVTALENAADARRQRILVCRGFWLPPERIRHPLPGACGERERAYNHHPFDWTSPIHGRARSHALPARGERRSSKQVIQLKGPAITRRHPEIRPLRRGRHRGPAADVAIVKSPTCVIRVTLAGGSMWHLAGTFGRDAFGEAARLSS